MGAPHLHDRDRWLAAKRGPGPAVRAVRRPSRRRFLRLRWPGEPIVTQTGREPTLTLSLQNVSNEPWVGTDAMDTAAYILDLRGRRLPVPGVWTWQPVREQRSIPSGGSVTITPKLMTLDVSRLPPGNYGLEAELVDLELKSDVGTLKLDVNGHRFLPNYGHHFSPTTAIISPHWWPCFLPAGGHESPHHRVC
jgi:hypothetical protein